MANSARSGGMTIKLKRPGALTARAKGKGNSVDEEIASDLKSGTPLEKKQAQFAENAKHWKHTGK